MEQQQQAEAEAGAGTSSINPHNLIKPFKIVLDGAINAMLMPKLKKLNNTPSTSSSSSSSHNTNTSNNQLVAQQSSSSSSSSVAPNQVDKGIIHKDNIFLILKPTSIEFKNPSTAPNPNFNPKLPRVNDPIFSKVKLIVGPTQDNIFTQISLLHQIPYFSKEFDKNPSIEEGEGYYEFVLPELDPTSVNLVIDFLWNDVIIIDLDINKIHEILKVAAIFNLDALRAKCIQLLEQQLSTDNCFKVYKIAKDISPDLLRIVDSFIMEQVMSGGEMSEFYQYGIEEVQKFIIYYSRGYSTPFHQLAIFKTGLKWIKYSEQARKHHLIDLLKVSNLSTLLIEDSLLPREKFSDGSSLDDDPQCAKLMGRVLQDIQFQGRRSSFCSRGLSRVRRSSIETPIEIVDLSPEGDGDGNRGHDDDDDDDDNLFPIPTITRVESLAVTQDDALDMDRQEEEAQEGSSNSRPSRFRQCKKRGIPALESYSSDDDAPSTPEQSEYEANMNDESDNDESLFEHPMPPRKSRRRRRKRQSINKNNNTASTSVPTQSSTAANSEASSSGYSSASPQKKTGHHHFKKPRVVARLGPQVISNPPQQILNLSIKRNNKAHPPPGLETPQNQMSIATASSSSSSASASVVAPAVQQQMKFKILYPFKYSKNHIQLYSYDFNTHAIPKIEHKLAKIRNLSGMVVTNHHIYNIGGGASNRNKTDNDSGIVEIFIKNQMNGEFHSKLGEPRRDFATVVLQNEIFVIGGCQGINRITNCVEKLAISDESPQSGGRRRRSLRRNSDWKPLYDHLNTPRGGLHASVLNNNIFAIGGIGEGGFPLNTVEIYKAGSKPGLLGKWSDGVCLGVARAYLKTIVCNDKLYAIGGTTSSRFGGLLASGEVYDPVRNEWSFIANMRFPRKNFGLIESNGILYAIGGNPRSSAQTIECYDPRMNQWSLIQWPETVQQNSNFDSCVLFP